MTEKKQSLIEFPCSFPIKIMGNKHPDFPAKVLETVQQHAPDAEHGHMTLRDSSSGNYQSITMPVNVESQEHLDNIYRALTAHPMVKVVL